MSLLYNILKYYLIAYVHDKSTYTNADKYTKSRSLLINIKNNLNFSNINLIKTGFEALMCTHKTGHNI